MFLYSSSTIFSSFITKSFFLFRRIAQSSLDNCPSDIKEDLCTSGIMGAVEASINTSEDKKIIPSFVDLMVVFPGPYVCRQIITT